MPETTLAAEVGRTTGSRSTRRLRAEGKIPGVVYGHGTEPLPVAVVAREFRTAMAGEAGLNTLLALEIEGKDTLTLARDVQRDPVRNVVTHVDFLIVRRDEVIAAEVMVNLVGEPIEVHHGDGVVDQQLFSVPVKAKPTDIPASIDVDISELVIGGALHVSDLAVPAGVTVEVEPETVVVTALPPRVQAAAGEEGAAPAAEQAEAADAEGAGGDSSEG